MSVREVEDREVLQRHNDPVPDVVVGVVLSFEEAQCGLEEFPGLLHGVRPHRFRAREFEEGDPSRRVGSRQVMTSDLLARLLGRRSPDLRQSFRDLRVKHLSLWREHLLVRDLLRQSMDELPAAGVLVVTDEAELRQALEPRREL